MVSVVGLGGEGILRTSGRIAEADAVIRQALERGITYFDSARVYRDSERYYGAVWGGDPGLRRRIFQTSKSASRDRLGALRDLDETLARLQTDYLDLWQIHDVRTMDEVGRIEGPGGALEAFVEMRARGRVRFIGVTGHHDPAVLTAAVSRWPVDAVLMPVNPAEELIGGFMTETLAAASAKGIAVIGMKLLGGGHFAMPEQGLTGRLLRYGLSTGITLPVVGCSSTTEVDHLADTGQATEPLSALERQRLLDLFRPHASQLAFYRKGP